MGDVEPDFTLNHPMGVCFSSLFGCFFLFNCSPDARLLSSSRSRRPAGGGEDIEVNRAAHGKRRWLRSVIRLLLAASLVATLGLAGVGAMHMGLVPPAYTPIPALDLSERGGLLMDWQLVDVGGGGIMLQSE